MPRYRRLFRGGESEKPPNVAETVEKIRKSVQDRGELLILYFNFDRYAKIEEIYGWEKLDEILETTTEALQDFFGEGSLSNAYTVASYPNDDDFVLLFVPEKDEPVPSDEEITELTQRLHDFIASRVEFSHGEAIAALFDTFIGRAHVYYDPKVRLERQIYRGIREAASVSRSVEQREFTRKSADLRETLRTGALYIEYHPIVVADTQAVFGYEALARGKMRSMRRPEVMFEIAAQSNLIWELSRLCRNTAIMGMPQRLEDGQFLFLNVDPHDFTDPTFTEADLDVPDPTRVVLEITERTAIKDYPKFRGRLKEFRDQGYRFAVDDAGSGYAGLGSIANLEPNFIKLDISLINCIDSNFIKQSLVESMVRFANDHGAMVIAEGVEREEEFNTVKQLGVHLVQGFFLHRPAPPPSTPPPQIQRAQ